jgi:cell division transport system permease protein
MIQALSQIFSPKSYVLPLHKKSGSLQLFILIILMTLLAVIISSIHLSLFKTVDNWRSLIEYQASIEIPALQADGTTISDAQSIQNQKRVIDLLVNSAIAHNVSLMGQSEVAGLLKPWLGQDSQILDSLEMPTIINFKVTSEDNASLEQLAARIQKIIPRARLQTHQNWLDKFLDIMRGVHSLGVLILIITLATTIFVISGAVRARMSIYKEELYLLHIMGATDQFILKQFVLYLSRISIPACFSGYLIAVLILSLLSLTLLKADIQFLPSFTFDQDQFLMLLLVPIVICSIALFIGCRTVLNEMRKMP